MASQASAIERIEVPKNASDELDSINLSDLDYVVESLAFLYGLARRCEAEHLADRIGIAFIEAKEQRRLNLVTSTSTT